LGGGALINSVRLRPKPEDAFAGIDQEHVATIDRFFQAF
jgi:hypothetical protein